MINTISTVFRYEWLQLQRGSLLKWMLLLMTTCAGYAIYYGNSSISKQLKNIRFVQQTNDSTRNTFYHFFDNKKRADSLTFGWAGMNSLYDAFTTEDFLENNVAVNVPNRFSHLSIGQRDIYPVYRKVTARSLNYDGSGISLDDKYAETSNPHKLLAGNFDLSFVLLYLFPLFIIALCYNAFSQEKETGTYSFIRNLPVALRKIIAAKFLFRFCLLAAMAVLFSVAGYLLSPVQEGTLLISLVEWIGVTLSYLAFWFAVSWVVVCFKQNSSVSALSLVGCWVLFLLIIPSLVNNYVAATYKISSRTAFVEALNKQVSSIWDLSDSITLSAYYKDYPKYAEQPIKPLWTSADSYDSLGKSEDIDKRYNKKLLVWHYYLDKQVQQQLAAYNKQLYDKQSAADEFSIINPVVAMQEALNDLAASGHRHQQRFRAATVDYRNAVFNLTNQHTFNDRQLTLEDYKRYPDFDILAYGPPTKNNYKEPVILLVSTLLLAGLGTVIFNKRQEA